MPLFNTTNNFTAGWHRVLWTALIVVLLAFSCKQPILEEICISVPYDPDSFDPHAKNTISNFAVSSNFYEPLVRADHNMKVQPALASSWENPDSLTWILHLQEGVRFHSGKKLEAEDVVYSFRRVLDDPKLEMRSYLANIREVEALDKSTIRIRTTLPVSVFLNKLNFVAIVSKGSDSASLERQVNGTGPYRLEDWKSGEELRLIRNEDYWGELPQLKRVKYLLSRSPKMAVEDLKAGKSQLVRSNTRDLQTLVQNLPDYELLVHDSVFVKFIAFDVARDVTPYADTATNPFKDKRVRQAFDIAVSRKELAARLPSFAVPLFQPVPPFVFGFNPQIPASSHDPSRAKQLLAEAGFPQGFSATLHSRNLFPEASAILSEQLARIGVRLKTELLSTTDFYDRLGRQDTSLYLTGFGAPTGDASNVLEQALHSRNAAIQLGESNWGGYSNPKVDADIESSISILEPEMRRKALHQIMAEVMEDLPWIPLYMDQDAYALAKAYAWTPRYDSYVIAREIRLR